MMQSMLATFLPIVFQGCSDEHVLSDHDWFVAALWRLGCRRRIAARTVLFSQGDPSNAVYVLESGQMLACRRLPGKRPSVRMLADDAVFVLGCGGVHIADCTAITDSVIRVVDTGKVLRLARTDPVMNRALRAIHANDLHMILQSLGRPDTGVRHEPAGPQSRRVTAESRRRRDGEHRGSAGSAMLKIQDGPHPMSGSPANRTEAMLKSILRRRAHEHE